MRITFNALFQDGVQNINAAAQRMVEAQQEVSSGKRISAPSDDPLGTRDSIAEHAQIARADGYTQSANAASSRLNVADSVLSDVINQLSSAQSTVLSGRGSGRTPAERDAVANELISIRNSLLRDINTQVGGTYLFSGSKSDVPAYQQSGSAISAYQGDSTPAAVDIGAGQTVRIAFDGGAIFQGGDAAHVLDTLTTLATAIRSGDDATVAANVDLLQHAFDRATGAQSLVGNGLQAVDNGLTQLQALRQNAQAAVSKIEDADMAEAITKLTTAQTAYKAALGAFANTGKQSLMDYL